MEHFGMDIFGASRRDAVRMVVVCFTERPCLRCVTSCLVALYVQQKNIKTNFVIKLLFQKTRRSTTSLHFQTTDSEDIHGNHGTGFGIGQSVVMLFQIVAKMFRNCLQLMVFQIGNQFFRP